MSAPAMPAAPSFRLVAPAPRKWTRENERLFRKYGRKAGELGLPVEGPPPTLDFCRRVYETSANTDVEQFATYPRMAWLLRQTFPGEFEYLAVSRGCSMPEAMLYGDVFAYRAEDIIWRTFAPINKLEWLLSLLSNLEMGDRGRFPFEASHILGDGDRDTFIENLRDETILKDRHLIPVAREPERAGALLN